MGITVHKMKSRKFPKLGIVFLLITLLGTSCTQTNYPPTSEPSDTPIPASPTSTVTLTPTSTFTPTAIPSPTISPTPDWESIPSEQLLALAPELPGYTKETSVETGVIAHDRGRYVVYIDNRETLENGNVNPNFGRVEWVFNTEVQEFERAARSIWTLVVGENGETAEIRTLVVTSLELEERFHGYFRIDQEDEEKLSRYVAVNSAVNWYSKLNPERFENTISMSDAQKKALVEESLAQYLDQVVRTGSRVELRGRDVNPDQMIFKFDYQRGVTGSTLLFFNSERAIRSSQNPEGDLVVAMRSGQNMLQPMLGQQQTEDYQVIDFRGTWGHGPLLQMGNLLIENDVLAGRTNIYSDEMEGSLYNQIMEVSFGEGNYWPEVNYSNLVNANVYPGLPSLHGEWVVGTWVTGSNR